MPVEVLDGVENPILVVHQPIQCITGAVGLGMRESFLELGGFVAQLEYLITGYCSNGIMTKNSIDDGINQKCYR